MDSEDLQEGFTTKQKLMIFLINVQQFLCYVIIGLIAPFFPDVAASKGATVAETGFIFSVMFLGVGCFSFLFGKYVSQIGPKFLYCAGLVLRIGCDIAFGFLNYMPSGSTFVVMAFIVRISESVGAAGISTASTAIVTREFPARLSLMFGLIQTSNYLGIMTGPVLGGLLYDVGGYTFCFLVFGGVSMVFAVLNMIFLPSFLPDGPAGKQRSSGATSTVAATSSGKHGVSAATTYGTLVRNPHIVLSMSCIFTAFFNVVFLEIQLQQHLDQFGLTPAHVGLMFMCVQMTYAVGATAWGWVCNRMFHPRCQIAASLVLTALGYVLLGPAPALGLDPRLWLVGLSLGLIGFGSSGSNIAAFKDSAQHALYDVGLPNTFETNGLISGLFMVSECSGAFLGPFTGGFLVEQWGFPLTMSVFAALPLAQALLNLLFPCVKPTNVHKIRPRGRPAAAAPPLAARDIRQSETLGLLEGGSWRKAELRATD